MKQYELPVTKPAFRLKGGSLAATVLELASVAPAQLAEQLAQKVAQAPQLLRHSPLIIDLDKLGDADGAIDLVELLATCRQHELQPVALRTHRADDLAQAQRLGLAVLPPSRGRERPLPEAVGADAGATPETAAAPDTLPAAEAVAAHAPAIAADASASATPASHGVAAAATQDSRAAPDPDGAGHDARATGAAPDTAAETRPGARPTRVVSQPVRGGQQIYAEGDLILLAPVSAGAEVMAEGHIHCYAPLRGRALAGVQGDTGARVFCRELCAELVAIAGHYRIADDLKADALWGKAAQVSLHDGQLRLVAL